MPPLLTDSPPRAAVAGSRAMQIVAGIALAFAVYTGVDYERGRVASIDTQTRANHSLFAAVCRGLNRRDQSDATAAADDARAWTRENEIEQRYPRPNESAVDVAYHVERRRFLRENELRQQSDAARRAKIARLNCPHLMARAYARAQVETNAPAVPGYPHDFGGAP